LARSTTERADARVTPHVLGLPHPVGGTDEEAVALDPDPDDVVARRAIRPQRGKVDVVRRVQEITNVVQDRDENVGAPFHLV